MQYSHRNVNDCSTNYSLRWTARGIPYGGHIGRAAIGEAL